MNINQFDISTSGLFNLHNSRRRLDGPWGSLKRVSDERTKPFKEDLRWEIMFSDHEEYVQICSMLEDMLGKPARWRSLARLGYHGLWFGWNHNTKWATAAGNRYIYVGSNEMVRTVLLHHTLAEAA
jgi:hypothetical protein